MDQWEREEEDLGERLATGEISQKEYNRQLRELHRDYRESAEESAQDAYDREMDNWQ